MSSRQSPSTTSSLMDLPNEILTIIATFLDARDINAFLCTSQRLARLLDFQLYNRARCHICADGDSVLVWAAQRGRTAVICRLFRESKVVHISPNERSEVRYRNAKKEMDSIFGPVVAEGRNSSGAMDERHDSISGALQVAAENGREDTTHLLLEMGANIAATDSMGENALHYAASGGQKRVTRLLLEKGADVTAKSISRETALHSAVRAGNEAVVTLLLDNGADIEATSSSEQTALHYAACYSHSAILKLLLDRGANASPSEYSRGYTPLHNVIDEGNEWAVRLLLERGANVMESDYLGHTPLHMASEIGNEAIAKLLLKKGAIVSASVPGTDDATPQSFAEANDNEAIAKLLEKETDD